MEQDFDTKHWTQPCPKYDCRKAACKCGLKYVYLPISLGDDSPESQIAPKNGAFCDALVVYEANGHTYIYTKEGIPTLVDAGAETLKDLEQRLAAETSRRISGDTALQQEIDDLKNSPDVVDIVATHADLEAYDTSKLGDKDILRVLADETHDGQSTYYRWDKYSETWTYIGPIGDYYTKGEVNALLLDKQDTLTAGSNITIAEVGDDLVISATGSAMTKFYFDLAEFDGMISVAAAHIYKDVSLTTVATAEDIRAALYTSGQADFIATEDNGDGPTYWHNLMICGTIPSQDGLSMYNGMSIVCSNSVGGGYFSIYTDSGPATTQFSFTVTT